MTVDSIIVFITASNREEAAKIAKTLVEEKLAGCVNIISNIRSIYSWQGKVEDEKEVLMIAKSRKRLFNTLENKVKELHSYAVPEIIAMPVVEGSADYLKWLRDVTGKSN